MKKLLLGLVVLGAVFCSDVIAKGGMELDPVQLTPAEHTLEMDLVPVSE